MVSIRTGELVTGSQIKVGDGLTQPTFGLVRVDGEILKAVIKELPVEKIAAECYAAVLLRAWTIPVPEPILIDTPKLMFGSVDAEYPSLKQKIGYTHGLPSYIEAKLIKMAAEVISDIPETPIAITCDEAIGNFDRNIGNILWDGANVAFIDHENAFGNFPHDTNKLASLILLGSKSQSIQSSSVSHALTINRDHIEASLPQEIDASSQANYVINRINSLATLVLNRFPKPQDLLNFQE